MRIQLALLAVLMMLGLARPAESPRARSVAAVAEDPLPCDPPPTHWCEVRGGTFNYVTCRCEFP